MAVSGAVVEQVGFDALQRGGHHPHALGLSRLSRARVNQARWAQEVEDRARAAAEKVSSLARAGGMSEAAVAEIRASILGIAQRVFTAA